MVTGPKNIPMFIGPGQAFAPGQIPSGEKLKREGKRFGPRNQFRPGSDVSGASRAV